MNQKIFYLLIISLGVLLLATNSQVLGIDFGTQFWKASLISPGKNLAIVENSRSERKTLNSIAFHDGVRFFQSQSLAKRLRKPQTSHFYLNRLIRSLDSDTPLDDYKFQDGTYLINQDDNIMTLEQVVGMILRNLKQLASIQAGTDIKDCVIAIPANWGPKAKMSLVNAAYLAQMSVLALINQNSAAAINFAITRNDSDSQNMMIFNLGSSNLQISVIRLWGEKDQVKGKNIQSIQALSHVVIDDVGGLAVDQQLANYLAQQFQKKHKIDPKSKERSFIKLLHQASQAKQTLSANKQTTVYVQQLIDGIDLQIPVKRQVIDQLAIFNSFNDYIGKALEKAGLKKQDINFVQLIGGASRIPRVTNLVKDYFSSIQVGAHMNGDQAMAFGCALRAANLSIALRVKQLHFYDDHDYQTRTVISSAESGVLYEGQVFTKQDHHGTKKPISINTTDQDLKISIYLGQDQLIRQYVTVNLSQWKDKFTDQNLTQPPTIVVNFISSSISIAQIKQIYVNVNVNTSQIKQIVDYIQQEDNQTQVDSKKQQNKQKQSKEQQSQANIPQTNSTQTNTTQQDKKQQKKQKPKKIKTVKKKIELFVPKTKKYPIKFDEVMAKYPKFTKQQIIEKKQIIMKFQQHQQNLKDKAKIRNQFQSTLYSIKDHIQDQYMKKFGKQQQVKQLKQVTQRQIQWLDQNSTIATKDDFETHFANFWKYYDPIYNRTRQYQSRQKTYNETMSFLSTTYLKTQDLNNTNEWLGEKITQQLKKINQTADQINKKIKEQVARPLNQKPIFYNNQMIQLAENLRDQYYLLKLIPRPKVSKEKPKQAPKEKESGADETVNLDDEEQEPQNSDQEKQKQQQSNQQPRSQSNDENQNNQQQQDHNNENQQDNEKQDDL